jgi:hypothetical protein
MQSSSFIRSSEGTSTTQSLNRVAGHTFASPVVRPLPRPTASVLADPAIW